MMNTDWKAIAELRQLAEPFTFAAKMKRLALAGDGVAALALAFTEIQKRMEDAAISTATLARLMRFGIATGLIERPSLWTRFKNWIERMAA